MTDSSIIQVKESVVWNLIKRINFSHILGHIKTYCCPLSYGSESISSLQNWCLTHLNSPLAEKKQQHEIKSNYCILFLSYISKFPNTMQTLYNTPHYNMDIIVNLWLPNFASHGIFQSNYRKMTMLKYDSLVTLSIPMDQKHSVLKTTL